MAEKSFSIRLAASVGEYVAAMNAAKASTVQMSAAAQKGLGQLGAGMSKVGSTMTRGITLPLAVGAAAAVKFSVDFESAFAKMVGLAGVTAGEVDGLKESVLGLAGETAVAPIELADALYFASSAGLDTVGAMAAVEEAARASAAGMGSTADVVGLVASAVASYGKENITAAEATDILTQTIKVGRAEPTELAATLGRVLPIAEKLGIGFAEVGGAVAYMTNIMGDTDRAVTSVNDGFAKLLAPGAQAKEVLVEMGTSADELHRVIGKDGLMGGLELLRKHGFAGNSDALRKLVPDMQGFQAMLALLNDKSGTLDATMTKLADSTGATDAAFTEMSETAGFKMKQAWVDLQIALVQVGDAIMPIVTDIASGVGTLASAFADLSPTVRTAVLAFLGVAAAMGPILKMGGALATNIANVGKGMGATATVTQRASMALAAMGAAIAVGAMVYEALTSHSRAVEERTNAVSDAAGDATSKVMSYNASLGLAGDSASGLALKNDILSESLKNMGEENEAIRGAFATLGFQMKDSGEVMAAFARDPQAAIVSYREELGLTESQAAQMGVTFGTVFRNAGEDLTPAQERLDAVSLAIGDLVHEAGLFDGEGFAEQQLAIAATSTEAGSALVDEARTMAELSGVTATHDAVYQNYLGLLAKAPAATQSAILGIEQQTVSLAAQAEVLPGVVIGMTGLSGAIEEHGQAQVRVASATERAYAATLIAAGVSRDAAGMYAAQATATGTLAGATEGAIDPQEAFAAASALAAEELQGLIDALFVAAGGMLSYEAALLGLDNGYAAFKESQQAFADGLADGTLTGEAAASAMRNLRLEEIGLAGDVLGASETFAVQEGAIAGSADAARIQIGWLEGMRSKYPELRDEINGYIGILSQVPQKKMTKAELQTQEAKAAADAYQAKLKWIKAETLTGARYETGTATGKANALDARFGQMPRTTETTGNFWTGGAMGAVDRLKNTFGTVPKTTESTANYAVAGALAGAAALIGKHNDLDGRSTSSSHTFTTYNTTITSTRGEGLMQSAEGRYVDRFMLSTLGEAGPEVVLPLTNPSRMQALVGDPRVYGKLVSAMDSIGGRSQPGGSSKSTSVTVNNHDRPVTASTIAAGIRAAEMVGA